MLPSYMGFLISHCKGSLSINQYNGMSQGFLNTAQLAGLQRYWRKKACNFIAVIPQCDLYHSVSCFFLSDPHAYSMLYVWSTSSDTDTDFTICLFSPHETNSAGVNITTSRAENRCCSNQICWF